MLEIKIEEIMEDGYLPNGWDKYKKDFLIVKRPEGLLGWDDKPCSNNVMIGARAGINVSTGRWLILIGKDAGYWITTEDCWIVIEKNLLSPLGLESLDKYIDEASERINDSDTSH